MGNFFEGKFDIPENADLVEFGKQNLAYSMMKLIMSDDNSEEVRHKMSVDMGFWSGFLTKVLMEQGQNPKAALTQVLAYQEEFQNEIYSSLER